MKVARHLQQIRSFSSMNIMSVRVLIAFVAMLSLYGCIHTAPFLDGQGRIIPRSIAVMETVSIGGIPQQVWFRGIDTRNPALLILPGGPGASQTGLFRSFNSELEQHFLVVNWEQRGTGSSQRCMMPENRPTRLDTDRPDGWSYLLARGRNIG